MNSNLEPIEFCLEVNCSGDPPHVGRSDIENDWDNQTISYETIIR